MLPNHAPLMVAERFKTLEALFPGRIDLGLGRAPGTDGVTALALRRRQDARAGDDFLERLQELILWETEGFPENHPFRTVAAMPYDAPLPPLWLLGSSGYSAELSARSASASPLRIISQATTPSRRCRATGPASGPRRGAKHPMRSWPSRWSAPRPRRGRAARLQRRPQLAAAAHGEYRPLPSPEAAAAYPTRPADGRMSPQTGDGSSSARRRRCASGSALVAATGCDEVMVTSRSTTTRPRNAPTACMAELTADAGRAIPEAAE
jgi:luciferase family oxidoreductase group 1